MNYMLKGAIHIHSTYSDGEFTLRELREIFIHAGCAFACLTDHAEAFDAEKLQAYLRDCDWLSDDHFRFVAGLEYECQQGTHILGYGVTSVLTTQDPQEVIGHVENLGGVSVLAHPKETALSWFERFAVLPHGIEVWNSKYDGRYAPRPDTFRFLYRLQERKPQMQAFYGQDLHWKKQFRGLFSVLRCGAPVREEILGALARGDYFGTRGKLELPSSGRLPQSLLARFGIVHKRSDRLRRLIKNAKGVSDRFGVTVPEPLKAHFRRIF